MKVSPVTHYTDPRYPARDILDEHPELLRVLPNRWRRSAIVGAALAATCGIVAAGWQAARVEAAGEPATKIAPIFQHGNGQGSFGCVAAAPPVFLSEDEARHVIVEEAKTAGITFAPDAQRLDLDLPITRMYNFGDDAKTAPKTRRGTLVLDGVDANRHIAFEYVSTADFYTWRETNENRMSTAWEIDLIGPARLLRDSLAKAEPGGVYGVFYDPAAANRYDITDGKAAAFSELTLAPLPFFKNFDGGRGQGIVNFYEMNGLIEVHVGEKSMNLRLGKAEGYVDGKAVKLPCAPVLYNRTPYLPLKWTVEQLGSTLTVSEKGNNIKVRAPGMTWDMQSPVRALTLEGQQEPSSVAFTYYDQETTNILARNAAREELRNQVRDFITWLKAEGVI